MSQPDSSELLVHALKLEPSKRLSLAAQLLNSVEEPHDAEWVSAWVSELDARLKLVDSGEDPGETWEAVKARALTRLGSR
jgi:putative addiction module component (TIGR02574 family)